MESDEREILPNYGRIPRDADISPEEWKQEMDKRREALIGATADVLSEYDGAHEAATQLNRVYAPFNVYDHDG
ncbi:MAG: hypothetical protein ABEN55_03260, partial [Bradymonadaceae bacterium]